MRFGPPSECDFWHVRLGLTASAVTACDARRLAERPLLLQNLLENRWEQHEIDELRIELRPASGGDHVSAGASATSFPIPTAMRHGIEGIGERHDTCGVRDFDAAQSARVSGAIPALMMREYAPREIRIEGSERREHLCTTLRMRRDCLALSGREIGVLVNDVEERFVDLADVVEQGHALDILPFVFVQLRGVGEDERVRCNTSDVGARFGIIRVDRVEEGFEARGGDPFARLTPTVLADQIRAGKDAGAESEESAHGEARGKIRTSLGSVVTS